MNELTQKYIDDCLYYTNPLCRAERKEILVGCIEKYGGEVVRIEDIHSKFIPEQICQRHYHTAKEGLYYVLSAVRSGVRSIGDPPPPGYIPPAFTKEYRMLADEYRRMFGDDYTSWVTFPGSYDDQIEVMKKCIAAGKPYAPPVSAVP